MTWLLDNRTHRCGKAGSMRVAFEVVSQLEAMVLRYWDKCGKESQGNFWAPKRGEPY